MYPKEFSAILTIGLILICAYLLVTGRLTGWQFGFAMLASLLVVIGIHNLDVIERMTLRTPDGSEAVLEIRQLRDEVYAKVDELKRVAAGIGTFTVASIVAEGRFVGEDHAERMLRKRDELDAFLREAGIGDAQRAEAILPITRMVDWDMRRAIVVNAVAFWRLPRGADPTTTTERDNFQRELERMLQQPDRLKGLADVEVSVRPLYDDANPILRNSVEDYRRLLTEGRLPKTGPQDDMRQAPR